MSDLEKMKAWLLRCPYLGTDTLHTERVDETLRSAGLYPLGMKVLSDSEDILGNRRQHCRYQFLLRQVVPENGKDADRLLYLQAWVQQNINAPRFSDEPYPQRIRAEDAHLERASQTGSAAYVVTITADFIKNYKE